jgi:tetraacyldisaccharide 4'-kinase
MSGPLQQMLMPLTAPASWIYGQAVAARNRGFDRGRRVGRVEPARPVISVGNITTGGVGKTPIVAWIAERLLAAGHQPVIAMRGYMARPGALSDEQAEYHERLPEVPVLADPDRLAALNAFLPEHPETDCILLDDGFQHRFVHRDLDLALIDATRGTMRDALIPRGRLREPLESLRRADAVIITHASGADAIIEAQVEHHHGKPPIAWSNHTWSHLRFMAAEKGRCAEQRKETSWLRGKRLVTMLGIGNPEPVLGQLNQAGASVLATIPAGDHERYDRAKLMVAKGLCDGTDGLLMTAKDWVKARQVIDWTRWTVPVIVPHLVIDVYEGAATLEELLLRVVRDFRGHEPTRT